MNNLVDEEINFPVDTANHDAVSHQSESKADRKSIAKDNNQKQEEVQNFNCEVTFNKKRNKNQKFVLPHEEPDNQQKESIFDQTEDRKDDKHDFTQPTQNTNEFNPFAKNDSLNFKNEYEEQRYSVMKKFSRDYNKFQRNAEENEVTGKFGGHSPTALNKQKIAKNPEVLYQNDHVEELPRPFAMQRHRWTSAEWDLANRHKNTKDTNQPSSDNILHTQVDNDNSMHENLFDAKESKIYSQDLSMEYFNKEAINDFYDDKRFSTDSDPHYKLFSKAIDVDRDTSNINNSEFKRSHVNFADRINNSQIQTNSFKHSEIQKPSKKLAFSELKPSSYRPFEEESKLKYHYDETVSTLGLEYTLLDPNEPLLLDTGVMKFHPGFSINYVSRWVQVTRTVIRFYKNYYHSVCSFRRPLAVIPIGAVGSVHRVKINSKFSKGNRAFQYGKNPFDQNQFEIVLKEDYEAIYDLNKRKREIEELKYELELIQKLDEQNDMRNKYKKYRKQ